jgi:choline dehydrogenase
LPHIITGWSFDVPKSDADLLAFARRTGLTLYHPTSSCPIGSVIDTELRVLGIEGLRIEGLRIEGLRIADASVMPSIVRGNTNAPTIMIAERAAGLIRGRTQA